MGPIQSYSNVLRPIIGGIKDSEEAVKYISSHPSENFKAIVIRSGHGSENLSKGGHKLVASQIHPFVAGKVTCLDLAAFILEAMKDESLERQYPVVLVED